MGRNKQLQQAGRGRFYRVLAPYYDREARRRGPNVLVHRVFPVSGVGPYSYTEVVYVLRVFTNRWLTNNTLPPPDLEPRAEETDARGVPIPGGDSFTLGDLETRDGARVLLDQVPFDDVAGSSRESPDGNTWVNHHFGGKRADS